MRRWERPWRGWRRRGRRGRPPLEGGDGGKRERSGSSSGDLDDGMWTVDSKTITEAMRMMMMKPSPTVVREYREREREIELAVERASERETEVL